jgi:negative regulator of replication initiation
MVLIRGVHVWIEIGTSLDDGLLEKGWKASQRANLLLSLCNMVSTEHKTNFNRVLSLKGRKRPYFSRNQNDLRLPSEYKVQIFSSKPI